MAGVVHVDQMVLRPRRAGLRRLRRRDGREHRRPATASPELDPVDGDRPRVRAPHGSSPRRGSRTRHPRRRDGLPQLATHWQTFLPNAPPRRRRSRRCYAGLAPSTRRSGTSIRGEHPSRTGNRQLKRAFFLAAFATLQDPTSRAYYDHRKRAQGKKHNAAWRASHRRSPRMLKHGTLHEDRSTPAAP